MIAPPDATRLLHRSLYQTDKRYPEVIFIAHGLQYLLWQGKKNLAEK